MRPPFCVHFCFVSRGVIHLIDTIESSAAYLWTLYFLAQHHSTIAADSEALHLINTAIDHTPSLPELWMLKARILKRGGDPLGALAAMDEARTLDGQDRFLNSKHAKYLLRAEKVTEAEACVGLFTKVRSTDWNDVGRLLMRNRNENRKKRRVRWTI